MRRAYYPRRRRLWFERGHHADRPGADPVTFGSGGHKPTLTGAGSTFVAPFFAVAFGNTTSSIRG